MQVTFLINGLLVFRCLRMADWPRQWLGYMGTNGLGNLFNYLIFSGLVLSGWPVVSRHGRALLIGSMTAYASTTCSCGFWCLAGPGSARGGRVKAIRAPRPCASPRAPDYP